MFFGPNKKDRHDGRHSLNTIQLLYHTRGVSWQVSIYLRK
nr:MAG TPA: hypothetical protein [Caudoviricetes sp.]